MRKPSEAEVTRAVGIGHWIMSGAVMVVVFIDIAGWNPAAGIFGAVWAGLFTASAYLNWRRGGKFRAVTWIIELLLIAAASIMAFGRMQAVEATSVEARVSAIHQTRAYLDAKDAWDSADRLQKAYEARIAVIPGNYTTGAGNNDQYIKDQKAAKATASKTMEELDSQARTAPAAKGSGSGGVFESMGPAGTWIEVVLAVLFALMNEVAAMANVTAMQGNGGSGKKEEERKEDTTKRTGTSTLSHLDYLRVALDGRQSGPLLGRNEVAKRLGIGEYDAKRLYNDLIKNNPQIRVASRQTIVDDSQGLNHAKHA